MVTCCCCWTSAWTALSWLDCSSVAGTSCCSILLALDLFSVVAATLGLLPMRPGARLLLNLGRLLHWGCSLCALGPGCFSQEAFGPLLGALCHLKQEKYQDSS